MSLRNSLAKFYVRYVFRDEGEFDPLKTQRELNVPDPPRGIARRCELTEPANVRAFWIDRQNSAEGILVYLHGGAFYFGPVKEHWLYIASICKRTGMAGIMVDYGIAPQRPYPIGMDEVIELFSHLELPKRWAILGDSSGAAMAISATIRLREMGAALPSKLILMSPWIDLVLQNPAIGLTEKDDVMMTVKRLSNAARAYVGEANLSDPDISPMFADLKGLPPVLIQIGTADLLLWDCRKFFMQCLDAGVEVKYEEYPDAFHDFMMLSFLPEAKRALATQTAFLVSK